MKHPEQPFEPGVEYVLGFAFNGNNVLLIRKTRPAWQAGRLNGVGGKVEPEDWCLAEAMRREFKEETGVDTVVEDWKQFAQHLKPGATNGDPTSYSLHVFMTLLNDEQAAQVTKTTDEEPAWVDFIEEATWLIEQSTPGCSMYVLMARNHFDMPFFTTTTEETCDNSSL